MFWFGFVLFVLCVDSDLSVRVLLFIRHQMTRKSTRHFSRRRYARTLNRITHTPSSQATFSPGGVVVESGGPQRCVSESAGSNLEREMQVVRVEGELVDAVAPEGIREVHGSAHLDRDSFL